MRTAVIDIGTNSVRMLIAEENHGEIEVIGTGLITSRLGEGIGTQEFLRDQAVERTIEALEEFKKIIGENSVSRVISAATSAVRDAANRDTFLMEVKKRIGWDVRVLSGTEEAEMSYLGAVRGLKKAGINPVVIDIGGGSTEFIWTGERGPEYVSVNIGAVRMTERGYTLPDIREMLGEVIGSTKLKEFGGLIGVGGTATTLAAINQEMTVYDREKIHGYYLPGKDIKKILRELEGMSPEQRKKVPGLQPQRADIIVAGTRILTAVIEGLKIDGITVSETDLMYGLLYRIIEYKM